MIATSWSGWRVAMLSFVLDVTMLPFESRTYRSTSDVGAAVLPTGSWVAYGWSNCMTIRVGFWRSPAL